METASNIPNSGNLFETAKSLRSATAGTKDLIGAVVDFSKAIQGFVKVDYKKLRPISGTLDGISITMKDFTSFVQDISGDLNLILETIDPDKFNSIRDLLISKQLYQELKTGDLTDKSIPTGKQIGLIDLITTTISLMEKMNSIKWVRKRKFKRNFRRTLRVLEWSYLKMLEMSHSINEESLRKINDTVGALQKVMISLPVAVKSIITMFAEHGKLITAARALVGAILLCGRNGDDGLINLTFRMFDDLEKHQINQVVLIDFKKNIDLFGKSATTLITTLAMVSILGPAAVLGAMILLGKKGGLLGLMMKVMIGFGDSAQDIKKANESILYLGLAMASLSLAVVLMAAAGAIAITSWKNMLMVGAFLVLVTGMFFLISKVTPVIEEGGKELLYIAATVGILSAVVLMLGVLGKYVSMEWGSILQIFALMGILVITFAGLAFASKWISAGTKEMLSIVISVAILSGLAMAMILIGKLISTDWGAILMIATMIGVLVGTIVGLAFLSGVLKEGETQLKLICLTMLALSLSLLLMSFTAAKIQWGPMLILLGITVLFVGICIGAGAVAEFIIMGAIAIGAVAVAMILLVVPFLLMVKVLKDASTLQTKPTAISDIINVFANGIKAVFKNYAVLNPITLALVMVSFAELSWIVMSIGIMAKVLQGISKLRIPTKYDSKGNPTEWTTMKKEDFVTAANNANLITTMFVTMFSGKDRNVAGIGLIRGIDLSGLDNVSNRTKRKFRQLRKIVGSIGDMASILCNLASLKVPTTVDTDGKLSGWRLMTGEDFINAAKTTNLISTLFISMFSGKDRNITGIGTIPAVDLTGLDNIDVVTKRKFRQLNKIVSFVGNMGTTLCNMAQLKMPTSVDADGNLTGWHLMTKKDFVDTAKNVELISTIFISMFSGHDRTFKGIGTIKAINLDNLDDITGRTKRKFDKINEVLTTVSKMAITMGNFSKLPGDPKDITSNITYITGTLINMVTQVDAMKYKEKTITDKLTTMEKLMNIYRKPIPTTGAATLEKETAATIALLKQIDSTNFNKLQYAYSLMNSLSTFSKSIRGNFDKLADIINEKLIDALEKLEKTLKDIDKEGTTASPTKSNILNVTPAHSGTDKKKTPVTEIFKGKQQPVMDTQGILAEIRSIRNEIGRLTKCVDGNELRTTT